MDINIAKTKEYYAYIDDSLLCDCSYCQCYREQIRSVYPKVAEYLDSLGVDIEKPFETSPLETVIKSLREIHSKPSFGR